VAFEADELMARLVQHELDHLNGVLMIDHLDEDQAKDAKRRVRELQMSRAGTPDPLEREPSLLRRTFRLR
jgi:peptide deformylase